MKSAFLALACLAFTLTAAADSAPVDSAIFGTTADALRTQKGEGTPQLAKDADGEYLAAIDYNEPWFGWETPLRAEYILTFKEPKSVMQITVHFPDDADHDAIINQVSTFLGEGESGPSGEGAPSVYFANWIYDSVRYDFQDYGDYKEMYIGTARFSPTEEYKLPEETLEIQRVMGTVRAPGAKHHVYLIGVRPEAATGEVNDLHLFVREPEADYRIGDLVEISATAGGSQPRLSLHDFDGDGLQDALITTKKEDRTGVWVVSLADKKGKVLLNGDEADWANVEAVEATDGKLTVQRAGGASEVLQFAAGKWTAEK